MEKRPLLRPAIPSPYAGAAKQKIVYVSTHTPFVSAVKRVEKLLALGEKRAVQSATAAVRQKGRQGLKGKRGNDSDEIARVAEEVENRKALGQEKSTTAGDRDDAGHQEEVVLKGTGKAIQRVLEMAQWFQQKERYAVKLKTGTVSAVDELSLEDPPPSKRPSKSNEEGSAVEGAGGETEQNGETNQCDGMEIDDAQRQQLAVSTSADAEEDKGKKTKSNVDGETLQPEEMPETRIRYASVLEVAIRLI